MADGAKAKSAKSSRLACYLTSKNKENPTAIRTIAAIHHIPLLFAGGGSSKMPLGMVLLSQVLYSFIKIIKSTIL